MIFQRNQKGQDCVLWPTIANHDISIEEKKQFIYYVHRIGKN